MVNGDLSAAAAVLAREVSCVCVCCKCCVSVAAAAAAAALFAIRSTVWHSFPVTSLSSNYCSLLSVSLSLSNFPL